MASFTPSVRVAGILERERLMFPACVAVGIVDLRTGALLASALDEEKEVTDLDLVGAAAGDLLDIPGEPPWADEEPMGEEVVLRCPRYTYLLRRCTHDGRVALVAACSSSVSERVIRSFGKLAAQALGRAA